MKPTIRKQAGSVTLEERPVRTVVIDDHLLWRQTVADYLEDTGGIAVVGAAGSGAAALRLVAELQPDVLLLDLTLPDQRGIEVARHVRAQWPAVAVFVLTGCNDEQQRSTVLRLGARAYLSKTSSLDDLVAAIQEIAPAGS